jgi:hypothetical protein
MLASAAGEISGERSGDKERQARVPIKLDAEYFS